MSTTHVRRTLARATTDLRKEPVFWCVAALTQILLIWSQDALPYAGTLIGSVFTVWLFARLFDRTWTTRAWKLVWVGLLHFPLTAAWPILASFHLNAGWFELFSLAWTLPMLFLLCVGEITLAGTVREILRGNGIDRSLALAWQDVAKRYQEVVLLATLGCFLFTVCLETRGAGFVVVTPFALAVLKDFFSDLRPSSREPGS